MRFYFDLNDGRRITLDREGTELQSEADAGGLAVTIARDISHNDYNRTRHWRVRVRNENHTAVSEVLFASVTDDLDYCPEPVRQNAIRAAQALASLADELQDVQASLRQLRATLSKARGLPYLAAVDGRRVDAAH